MKSWIMMILLSACTAGTVELPCEDTACEEQDYIKARRDDCAAGIEIPEATIATGAYDCYYEYTYEYICNPTSFTIDEEGRVVVDDVWYECLITYSIE